MKIEKTKFIFYPLCGVNYNSSKFSLPIEIETVEQGAALLGLYELITRYGDMFLNKINLQECYYRVIKSARSSHSFIEITLCDTENDQECVMFINDHGQIYSGSIPVNSHYRFYNQLLFDISTSRLGDLTFHKLTRLFDPNDIDPVYVVYWADQKEERPEGRYKELKELTNALYCKSYVLCYSPTLKLKSYYFTGHFTRNFY